MLRSVSQFETAYLTRSAARLSEASGTLAPSGSGGALSQRPARAAGAAAAILADVNAETLARVVANELDAARFDPTLLKRVAAGVEQTLEGVMGKASSMVSFLLAPKATGGRAVAHAPVSQHTR
jgi:hypothetical protein